MLNLDKTIRLAKERGLSNTYLAKKLGRSSASLFVDWRKGKSKPTDSDIEMLADILVTTVDYLTDKTEQKNKPAAQGDELDPLDKKIIELFSALNPDNRKIALAQIETLLRLQEKK